MADLPESWTLGSLTDALDAQPEAVEFDQPRDSHGRFTEASEDLFGRPMVWDVD